MYSEASLFLSFFAIVVVGFAVVGFDVDIFVLLLLVLLFTFRDSVQFVE